jgi:type I restriction enzyme S subunit
LRREIPEGWEVKYLTEEMDLQYGFPFSTELFNEDGIGIPVIRIRDILNCSISIYSTEEISEKYRLNKGDILVGMDGNFHINYWNKEDCFLNQRSLRIRSKNESISEIQAKYSIEPFIKAREKNVSRTTVAHLSAKDINDLKILKAEIKFQTKANNYFKSILERLVSNRNQNQQLSELRDWLLPMLMNGQVKVS